MPAAETSLVEGEQEALEARQLAREFEHVAVHLDVLAQHGVGTLGTVDEGALIAAMIDVRVVPRVDGRATPGSRRSAVSTRVRGCPGVSVPGLGSREPREKSSNR